MSESLKEPYDHNCKICGEPLSDDDWGTNDEPTKCEMCDEWSHFNCGINVNYGFICNNCRNWG